MDWLDLLAVQGTLKSLLQHHSSKPSILQCSAFFTVQLSHPYMTTGKTIALIRQTLVSKVMSLCFIMLSMLVITFLPKSKRLLISWLQSPSAVILEPPKIKSATVSSSNCHEVMWPDAMKWCDQLPWSSFSECWALSQLFHSPLSHSSRGSLVLLYFLPEGWCHIEIKQAGWQYIAMRCSFPDLEQVCCSMSSSNCCFLTCIQISQKEGQVVWYSHLIKIFYSLLWFTQSKALA